MPLSTRVRLSAFALLAALVTACAQPGTPAPSRQPASSSSAATPSATPGIGEVVPAPGSESSIYEPNPGALVVAIDPGHGGCLDWGVPNPWDNTVAKAEKKLVFLDFWTSW